MALSWSPHPRYLLYTSKASYGLPLQHLFSRPRNSADATARLEAEICQRFEVSAAVCVPMARTGLYFGLRELIRPGQTVILSPLTIIDVVNMVLLAGGIPLFTDIRRQSCTIDPEQAESLIDSRTGAVLITHLHGESAGAHVFRDICRRRAVPLIEDAAQAFGALESDRRLGTIGNLGIYSFGFYKNVNTWRGGMLVSPDPDLIARIRRRMEGLPVFPGWRLLALSLHGLITDAATWPPLFASFTHPILRYSYLRGCQVVNQRLDPEYGATRLTEIPPDYLCQMTASQAALALCQLDRVDVDTTARIDHAARYHQALASLDGLITPRWQGRRTNIYTYYPIQCREREALLQFAMCHKRDFAAQHLRNCADLPEFKEFYRHCPNSRASARELILLPTYPRYPSAEIQRNIEAIQEFFRSK
jgi:dTDP-4-amino-4,6-dideoxygalactose transaminase